MDVNADVKPILFIKFEAAAWVVHDIDHFARSVWVRLPGEVTEDGWSTVFHYEDITGHISIEPDFYMWKTTPFQAWVILENVTESFGTAFYQYSLSDPSYMSSVPAEVFLNTRDDGWV